MSVEPLQMPDPTASSQLAAPIRDGHEIHQAALRHGLNVVLYPRQVLMVTTPDGEHELSFIHGIPQSSTLAAVTYAQDKRMRRAHLERAGVPVPRGATFSVGRGLNDAKNFAERIGYPIVVKPAMGDNAIETFHNVLDEDQFDRAIDYLRTPPTERDTFVRSAYALTELREPGEEEGRVVVPPGYRFLIEEQVKGEYIRILVVGGEARSAVLLPVPPSSMESSEAGQDVFDELHATARQLAADAIRAVPGLTVGFVDLVVTDHRHPVADQHAWVVELGERPGLSAQASVSGELSQAGGASILRHHAGERSIDLPDPQDDVAVEFHAAAVPDLDGAVTVIAEIARSMELSGYIEITDRVEGIADGVLQGPAQHIAWLAEMLVDGTLAGHSAMLVEERHRERQELDTFTVR
ncbi:hypothetical protein EF847_03580 [Actinobacteria bacterium YIM 96077]|uniref:ATP-grasp domain-containing protein n=1 Tax=Phytoactinopolyspora halophila TaxID=1981511 RepID=A0A329R2N7_9ACTN|nr:hypothetical protein [Phytoactinopolyspora halophila]AYY11926.1 hypothetical protein EF847_03580 [Actinobacteria bacterium YIM 96077]RAW18840.1 hypothetical protein DPM12_01930 [Phytoactinopolyspora halophila]